MCTQQRKTLRSKSASSTFFFNFVFFLLCGVSFFFHKREREREVSHNQKKDEKDKKEHRALMKKRDLYRKRVRKEKKLSMDDDGKSLSNGKMTGKKSSGVSVDMYNQLKKEQEELWRITHQLYSEVEKVGVVSNGTRQDLIGVLAQLADISSSISSSSSSSEKREEEKEGVGGGGIDEDIASMKNDIDEHTEKIDTLIELISTLKEEEIPSMLKAKEKAIVERVSAYVKELKALVAKKETVQKTKSINSSDSSPPASSSSPGKKS